MTREAFDALPERQKTMALLAIDGLSNKEIGNLTGVVEATVKVHLKAVYKAVGVRSRSQLVNAYLDAFGIERWTKRAERVKSDLTEIAEMKDRIAVLNTAISGIESENARLASAA